MTLTFLLSRIEIALWNALLSVLTVLRELRARRHESRPATWQQVAAQTCLWAAIGLALGFTLGLLGIQAW